jgi:hypothetical protein
MLRPYDHVTLSTMDGLSTMEFVLCHLNTGPSVIGESGAEWYAKDEGGNSVILFEGNMVKLPGQAYNKDVLLHEPAFYRERGQRRVRIDIRDLCRDIYAGKLAGTSIDDNYVRWQWDIQNMTLKNNNETWLLRVFTMGGWWL